MVVLIHGGFWKQRWALDLMTGLADDLATRGIASWNIEYRRVGTPTGSATDTATDTAPDGGWPQTGADVALAIDALATLPEIDADRVVFVGHSAGGHLALWAGLATATTIAPRCVVGLGPVADLAAGSAAGVGNGDIERFLGGSPAEIPDIYADASPSAHLPSPVEQLIVAGRVDEDVPIDHVEAYVRAVEASASPVRTITLEGVGHMELIDPTHEAWRLTARAIERTLRPNIALTGFMGTGKTTVGRRLAERLGYAFVDTDDLVEEANGPIAEIFASAGEAAFRALETAAVESLDERSGLVVATGGGLVTNDVSARHLESTATVVTLTAPPDVILERVGADGDTRPLLAGPDPAERISELLAERAAAYGRYPAIDATADVESVTDAIIATVIDASSTGA